MHHLDDPVIEYIPLSRKYQVGKNIVKIRVVIPGGVYPSLEPTLENKSGPDSTFKKKNLDPDPDINEKRRIRIKPSKIPDPTLKPAQIRILPSFDQIKEKFDFKGILNLDLDPTKL